MFHVFYMMLASLNMINKHTDLMIPKSSIHYQIGLYNIRFSLLEDRKMEDPHTELDLV